MNSSKHLWSVALIFVSVVAVRLYVISSGAAQLDDAFITYRYAENIAAGNGFVYNLGERVLGTTTPLYTLLLAGLSWLGFSTPQVSQGLGLLASGLTGIVLYFFCRRLNLGNVSYLAVALYACWPNAINCDISGMETPLFTLGALAFFYTVLLARYQQAALLAALLTLLRPEGALLVVLLVVFFLASKRRKFAIEALIIVALVLPWLIFSWSYFGSVIPNSVPAKLALYLGYNTGTLADRFSDLLGLSSPLGWLSLLGAIWGLTYLLMRVFWGWLEALYIFATLVPLALSHTALFYWYKAPLAPLWILFITAGCAGALHLAGALIKQRRVIQVSVAAVALTLIPALYGQVERSRKFQQTQAQAYLGQHRRAGEYLAKHAKSGEVVVAEDIGYLGYVFRGTVVDRDGLVSPEAISFNRNLDYTGLLRQQLQKNPGHWLFIAMTAPTAGSIVNSGILTDSYSLVENFAPEGQQDYLLYRAN